MMNRNMRTISTRMLSNSYSSRLLGCNSFKKNEASNLTGSLSSISNYFSTSQTQSDPTFGKILVANRGEIARRIFRTCAKEKISTVAIHSTIDSKSPHVVEADEAVCVGTASSSSSYLDLDNICKAIELTGADAVHPGYGFLSENADFARRVEELISPSGKAVNFIGPSSDAIIKMGDKITSKKIAKKSGVNIIPGYEDFVESQDHAVAIANKIGYPVMIKATSGGGGKGMRICYTDTDVREGFLLSTAEAKSFFKDERLFIEKFIENPHHIEFQVLAGRKNGGELDILCFPERECSIQRRNQKILEESPSVLLKEDTRAEMVRQVKQLVREVDYSSAGTVEFLVDENQNFYFLEMNTRLQVEHPVTEMVSSGIDLVHAMIDIAAGKGIPQEYLNMLGDQNGLTESEREGLSIPHSGHAIEARIYAEDPFRGFLPSTGYCREYIEPELKRSSGRHEIRVDSGVVPGSIISQYYDPMISKLVVHSPDGRIDAINGLRKALDSYVMSGIKHNCSFLSDVVRRKAFINGKTPTNFIERHYPDGFKGVQLSERQTAQLVAIAAKVVFWRDSLFQRPSNPLYFKEEEGAEPSMTTVCLGGLFGSPFFVESKGDHLYVTPYSGENCASQSVQISTMEMDVSDPIINAVIDDIGHIIQIGPEDNTGVFNLIYEGVKVDVIVMSPKEFELATHMKEPKKIDVSNVILSPMPGILMSYSIGHGEKVVENQDVCIIEAMKMQNIIRAPRSGIIKKLHVQEGASLMADEVVVEFEKRDRKSVV